MQKRLVYFENWMDPVADRILGEAQSVDLQRLEFGASAETNWAVLENAHGYQCRPKTELPKDWFGTRDMMARCKNLLALSATGAGFDMIDVAAATEMGILVVNNTGANSVSVAQHALGMMLALSKQIVQADRAMRRIERVDRFQFVGSELTGKTVAIIGLGNIGRRVAAYVKVFGCNVIAYDPHITDADFAERGAVPVSFTEAFAKADFVTVHCPLTDETRGMIGPDAFSRMKPNAYFITTARGGIHDEAALVDALQAGAIRGAGVDVFEVEPTGASHPLGQFENVLMSPHNAGITHECNFSMAENGAHQWIEIFEGRRPPRLCNPDVWPAYQARFERITGESLNV